METGATKLMIVEDQLTVDAKTGDEVEAAMAEAKRRGLSFVSSTQLSSGAHQRLVFWRVTAPMRP
jgi:ABC-type hemin transport system ATPase subunit